MTKFELESRVLQALTPAGEDLYWFMRELATAEGMDEPTQEEVRQLFVRMASIMRQHEEVEGTIYRICRQYKFDQDWGAAPSER